MLELGELEKQHAEFEKRKTRVVVASLEDSNLASQTQADFPHLIVLADADRSLVNAVNAIHPRSAMDGGDTAAPTTLLIDGNGTVRWIFRPDRFLTRASPAQVLQAVDERLAAK
jgi:peroxiredoxin